MKRVEEKEPRESLRQALSAMLAERGVVGEHPPPETLQDYRIGDLGASDEARIQEHLLTCPRCLEDFLAQVDDDIAPPSKFERAAAWRVLRSAVAASQIPPRTRGFERWAALFLCAVLATYGAWVNLELKDLRQPQLNLGILDVLPIQERGGASRAFSGTVGEGAVTLVLPFPGQDTFSRYDVEILDSEGKRRWKLSGPLDVDRGTWTLFLPPGSLAPGEYRIRLIGLLSSGERERLEEWPIEVRGEAEGD